MRKMSCPGIPALFERGARQSTGGKEERRPYLRKLSCHPLRELRPVPPRTWKMDDRDVRCLPPRPETILSRKLPWEDSRSFEIRGFGLLHRLSWSPYLSVSQEERGSSRSLQEVSSICPD